MNRSVWTLVPALTAGFFFGCGGSDDKSEGDSRATGGDTGSQTGIGGGSSTGSGGATGGGNTGGASSDDEMELGDAGEAATCPSSCEQLNADCGAATDTKCGGIVQCGTCAVGVCGAEEPNRCGGSTPETPCTPKTCDELGANCGSVGDGCGSLVQCGSCPTGQTCGVLTPNHCDIGTTCTPFTCSDLAGVECGIHSDGCGNTIDCGSCATGEKCVTEGGQSQCIEEVVCQPLTCEAQGVECGVAGDGCGNTLDCGNSCVLPRICGGNPAEPGKCGCEGVCGQIPDCAEGTTTSISGQVFDPGGRNPLYNALVYIPNNPSDPGLLPFEKRTNVCDVCGATAAGDPLMSTQTGVDGSFTLTGVPVGEAITLVIQLGRWRRIFQIDITTPCEENALPDNGILTMPKNREEGDIPRIANVTGSQDGMECVLWKAGVDTEEFTNPDGEGRVHMYLGSGPSGAGTRIDNATPYETDLYVPDTDGQIPLTGYDMLILSCQGSDNDLDETRQESLAYWRDLVSYADNGGRVFATHWSYSYMRVGGAENPLSTTATWMDDERENTSTATVVNDLTVNPKAAEFAAWLELVGALDTPVSDPATFDLVDPRFNVAAVTPPGQTWVTAPRPALVEGTNPDLAVPEGGPLPAHYTFNTPVSDGTGASCGRFVYSDFHVSAGNARQAFPDNCGSWDDFSAQEKVLEFMLFDLSSCVTPYTPLCTPTTCEALGYECGAAGDGCGASLDCGPCPPGEVCGLISPNQCDAITCSPTTCEALGYECGMAGDGCGNAIDCGPCPEGWTCGAAGPNKCGTATCTPTTCEALGYECGMVGDGCGNALDCGECPPPAVCGLFEPGKCGTPTCTPKTCAEQDIECGAAGDGCGAALDCGPCPPHEICGLNEPGKCAAVM